MTSASELVAGTATPAHREHRGLHLVERNVLVYRRAKLLPMLSGFFEPVFYLLSFGFGIGTMVERVHTSAGPVSYAAFVGPGLLAAAAMNDAVYDTTYTMYSKLRYARTYDAILATPMAIWDIVIGEMIWIVLRTVLYSAAFFALLAALDLTSLIRALLVLPAAMLLGFTFAALGLVAATAMRDFDDWEFVQLAIVPLYLFSSALYPLSVYPRWLADVVVCTPLYQGIALVRDTALGMPTAADFEHAAYLLVFGLIGLGMADRRLSRKLMR